MRLTRIAIVGTLVSGVPLPGHAVEHTAMTSPVTTDVGDEVLVQGTRLRELKAAIVEAEDRFYERYNELNKVDEFDIECATDSHTGTKIPQRRCFTRLQRAAVAQNAREVVEMFHEQDRQPDGQNLKPGRPPNTDPQAIWLARFDDYRINMLYLLKMNPDLRRMAAAREEAEKRYEAERRRRLKGRLALYDQARSIAPQ